MNRTCRSSLALFATVFGHQMAVCQIFQQIGISGHYETSLIGGVNGVVVGSPGVAPVGIGLLVDGANLNTPTGEVFRTDAPNGANTSWRLLRGGTNYGRLFNLSSDVHLRLDASAGDLLFLTNGLERGRFNQTVTQTINTYGPLDLSGFLGVGDFTGSIYSRAAARFHSESNSSTDDGYRPVIGQGFLATRGETLCYTGLLGAVNSGTIWSQVTGSAGTPGSYRFIYTGNNGPGTTDQAEQAAGLELGRFEPAANLNEGYFGIGDWASASATPDERLDILNRTVKIRRLIPDYNDNSLTNVVVADANGKLHWRNASTLGGCDWEVTGTDNVVTAYLTGPLTGCPDQTNNVGIGTSNPSAKLDIIKVVNGIGATDIGVNVRMGTTSANNYGGNSDVQTSGGAFNMGWRGSARNAARNWGLDGNAATNSLDSTVLWSGVRVVGVRGFADGNFLQSPSNVRGVWGIGRRPASGGWGYGGWFDGFVYSSAGYFGPSDAQLKDNVQPLTDAMPKLLQVHPKSFRYKVADFPTLGLDDATHFGVIAQDLETVFPELVRDAEQPAAVDSLGNVIYPAVQFKTVNEQGLVPWLLVGMQEQQAMIAQQNARIDQLEQLVAQCCANGATDSRAMHQGAGLGATGLETDLRIIPNPVTPNTQLRYTLANAGRIRLEITDNSGRVVEVLENTTRTAGNFTYEWNTQQLASGTYYCALYLNDERLVQKAVKLSER
jgi:hypothetical protein